MDTYFTLKKALTGEFRDKGSRFLSYAQAVLTEADIKEFLNSIKEIHPKATHHCYAYRLGMDKYKYRANDDGEPSGTAGKPILGQIDSKGLTNTMVIIVRYFGGTKLGVPGLINAYKTSTREILENAPLIEKTIKDYYELSFDYVQMNEVMRVLKREKVKILHQDYDKNCKLHISIRQRDVEKLVKQLEIIQTLSTKFIYTA